MGLFPQSCPHCGVEDKNLDWLDHQEGKHKCKIEDLRRIIEKQRDKVQEYFGNLHVIQNAVQMLLKEVPSTEAKEATVKTEWLKKLWDATQMEFHHARVNTPDSFIHEYGLLGRISLLASRLFKKYPTSMERRLEALREVCIEHKEYAFPTDPVLDVTVEDIIREVRNR